MLSRTGPENTAFIKEFQRKESKDAINFIKQLPEAKKAELTGKEESTFRDAINFIKQLPEAKQAELTGKEESTSKHASAGNTPGQALKSPVRKEKRNPHGHIPDQEMLNRLSMNLWRRVNAGYMIERRPCLSLSQASYTWDGKLLDKTNRQHMHKRDMFSEYVEAAARFKVMIKSNEKAAVPKYIPLALLPQTPGRKWYAPVMKLPPGYKGLGSDISASSTAITPASTAITPVASA